MIFFSVVIPLYNKEKTIRSTLESVLNQSYPHFEIIVVDDGSTDAGPSAVRSMDEPRIRLVRQENAGPGAARNLGVRQAHYDWIVTLDADDLMLPGALDTFAFHLDDTPEADMVVGNFELEDHDRTWPYRDYPLPASVPNSFRAWFMKELMPCAGTYACKKYLLTRNPYKPELRRSEDTEVLFNIFREAVIIRTDVPVMRYRRDYSVESRRKGDIGKDFQGHLSFDRWKPLWERICLYELYVEAKNNYPDEVHGVYPDMGKRVFLKAAYHAAFRYRAFLQKRRKK